MNKKHAATLFDLDSNTQPVEGKKNIICLDDEAQYSKSLKDFGGLQESSSFLESIMYENAPLIMTQEENINPIRNEDPSDYEGCDGVLENNERECCGSTENNEECDRKKRRSKNTPTFAIDSNISRINESEMGDSAFSSKFNSATLQKWLETDEKKAEIRKQAVYYKREPSSFTNMRYIENDQGMIELVDRTCMTMNTNNNKNKTSMFKSPDDRVELEYRDQKFKVKKDHLYEQTEKLRKMNKDLKKIMQELNITNEYSSRSSGSSGKKSHKSKKDKNKYKESSFWEIFACLCVSRRKSDLEEDEKDALLII